MQDPRWNSPNQARSNSPATHASLVRDRDASPAAERSGGSFSIVFSASWVNITTPIGEGAFSRVYEGVYTNPETLEQSVVAVKVLKKNMLKRRSDCLRFIKEAKIVTRITHSNIAACYGIGKYDDDDEHNPGSLFIVQELVKGGNLLHKVYKQMLNRNKRVYSSQEALNWMINVAEGMQYLHSITDNKPMIIHRDLKLENIMLAPWNNGTISKLVDFGLHKVIDDRIKKVVKRVASEAFLGNRLGLRRPAATEEADEEEDELEMALAQQREKAAEDAGADTGSGPSSPTAASRLTRGASRLSLASPAMAAHPEGDEEEDEEEAAIARAQAGYKDRLKAEDGCVEPSGGSGSSGSTSTSAPTTPHNPSRLQRGTSRLSLAAPAMAAHPEEEEEDEEEAAIARAQAEYQPQAKDSPADPKTRLRAPPKKTSSMQKLMARVKDMASMQESNHDKVVVEAQAEDPPPSQRGESPADPGVARLRAPPKKTNSMQKLVAKMKEIKLRVTGKLGDAAAVPSTSSSQGSSGTQAGPLPPSEGADPLKDKMARNEALLNRIIEQQATAQNGKQAVLDDLGIAEGALGQRARKAPPRRAVTWVNEIRYNLTEAVGSWAYMAPEVVLGQPYNEKVDVFSFGVILFEVLNRKLMLVDEIKNDPRKDAQAYAERVAHGFRPEVPRRWPPDLVELITSCWAQDPHMRPNFTAVLDVLKQIDSSGDIGKLDVAYFTNGSAYI